MKWAKEHIIDNQLGTLLYLYVQPGASKNTIKGEFASDPVRLKISVSSPPVDGAANRAVIEFISKKLAIAKSKIHLVSGETSRQKNIWIEGINAHECEKILGQKS